MTSNLLPGDANKAWDVFVRDLQSGTTELISVSTNGGFGAGSALAALMPRPQISGDGRYVVFYSTALDLAPVVSGTNFFLRDRTLATTYALTISGAAGVPSMTPDGRYIAYLDSGFTTYVWNSSLKSRVFTNFASPASMVSLSSDGRLLAYGAGYTSPLLLRVIDLVALTNWNPDFSLGSHAGLCFSGDGRYLVFSTSAGLSSVDNNYTNDIYLHDFVSGTNLLVSRNFASTAAAAGAADSPAISPDGRFIAYRSFATNCVPGDSNNVPDLFLYDVSSGATTLLSASRSGNWSANNRSAFPVFSGDSQTLIFQSWASDLAAQDCNWGSDVFLASLSPSNSVPPFCAQVVRLAPSGTGTEIVWPVASGATYSVQFKNNLSDAWRSLSGQIVYVGNTGYFVDPAPVVTHRFYRVVASQ